MLPPGHGGQRPGRGGLIRRPGPDAPGQQGGHDHDQIERPVVRVQEKGGDDRHDGDVEGPGSLQHP